MNKGWIFEGGTPPLPPPTTLIYCGMFLLHLKKQKYLGKGYPMFNTPNCKPPASPLVLSITKAQKYFTILDSFVSSNQKKIYFQKKINFQKSFYYLSR